jgi:hypothetical protein
MEEEHRELERLVRCFDFRHLVHGTPGWLPPFFLNWLNVR